MLRWDSTTPLGVPSEPEVNRIDGRIVGLAGDARRGAGEQAGDLVARCRSSRGRPRDRRCAALREIAADQLVELALLDEGARGQHGLDLRGLASPPSTLTGAGREVQHRRHAADGLQRHERRRRRRPSSAAARRQFSPTSVPRLELAAQHLGAEDQLAIGQLGAERILDDRLAGVAVAIGMAERLEQGLVEHARS